MVPTETTTPYRTGVDYAAKRPSDRKVRWNRRSRELRFSLGKWGWEHRGSRFTFWMIGAIQDLLMRFEGVGSR